MWINASAVPTLGRDTHSLRCLKPLWGSPCAVMQDSWIDSSTRHFLSFRNMYFAFGASWSEAVVSALINIVRCFIDINLIVFPRSEFRHFRLLTLRRWRQPAFFAGLFVERMFLRSKVLLLLRRLTESCRLGNHHKSAHRSRVWFTSPLPQPTQGARGTFNIFRVIF